MLLKHLNFRIIMYLCKSKTLTDAVNKITRAYIIVFCESVWHSEEIILFFSSKVSSLFISPPWTTSESEIFTTSIISVLQKCCRYRFSIYLLLNIWITLSRSFENPNGDRIYKSRQKELWNIYLQVHIKVWTWKEQIIIRFRYDKEVHKNK